MHDHDRGLAHDLGRLQQQARERRVALRWLLGAGALTVGGIVRSDIRASIAGATGVATGVPPQVIIELVNANASCADLSGYAIYLWQCDAEGRYSMYSSGATAENDLRGVQATAGDGIFSIAGSVGAGYVARLQVGIAA
ncbi:hypothetical protein [Roseateles saccharophilus]|uniref:Uncharacterized protein n=1 Tax=Roseateles saccharophilus TaxID=304 RepID=A0A4R3V0G8_ROSSA|nr:hypothetical protein [Roseateles saccharophilus]TCU97000.1 hypothetical protein EV671_101211 [Roseateles saccharophilus]